MAAINDIIGGTFESLGMPRMSQAEQLQWLRTYGTGNPALSAINAASPKGEMAPASWMAYQGGAPVAAPMPPLPRSRPAGAPTTIDMAAINAPARQPVSRVTGQMQPSGGSGGLLELFLGKSKNGLPGLAGLLGGPQQGGLLQMLLSRKPNAAIAAPATAVRPMTSAERYAALNSGPGSVAAMELLHSGASRNPQSGGPAGGGEYASGGR